MRAGLGFKTGPKFMLDLYPTAAMAFSLRKVRASYSGNCIRIRRSSDNTLSNIGFTSVGELDESAITSFVGSNDAFVETWYDQSGNARNATQSINARQPKIVAAGSIIRVNGTGTKPTIRANQTTAYCSLDTNYSTLQARPFSIICAAKLHALASNPYGNVSMFIAGSGIYAGDGSRYSMNCNDTVFDYFRRNDVDGISQLTAAKDTNWHIHQGFWRSTTAEVRARTDSTDYGPTTLTGTEYNSTSVFTLFSPSTETQFTGDFSIPEVFFYGSDKYDNRLDFEARIKSYWGL